MAHLLLARDALTLDEIELVARTNIDCGVVVEWNRIMLDYDSLRVLHRRDHEPQDETDGHVVFESNGRTDTTTVFDPCVRPRGIYHYAIFMQIESVWYRPQLGLSNDVWSGPRPALLAALPRQYTTLDSELLHNSTFIIVGKGAGSPDWQPGQWGRVTAPTGETYSFLCKRADGAIVYIDEPWDELPIAFPEESVIELLAYSKTLVADRIYGAIAKRRTLQNDQAGRQHELLTQRTMESGDVAQPGGMSSQLFYERFSRVAVAHKALAYEAAASLPLLTNPFEAPLLHLAHAISRYGTTMPAGVDGWEQRTFFRIQPYLARLAGVESALLKIIEIQTGQTLVVRFGRDRTVKLNTTGQGIGSRGFGVYTGLSSTQVLDSGASPPSWWVGRATLRLWSRDPDDTTDLPVTAVAAGAITVSGGNPATLGTLFTGDSDDPVPQISDAITYTFTAPDKIQRSSGNWGTLGFGVGVGFVTQGATNTANRGRMEVLALSTTSTTNDTIQVDTSAIVNETSTKASFVGGIVASYLFDKDATFTDAVLGATLIPETGDVGGPSGTPRRFVIDAHGDRWVHVERGSMQTAEPGSAYRICDKYQILLPSGGRYDPRLSLYNPDGLLWNDNGMFVYLDDPVPAADLEPLRAEVLQMKPSSRAVLIVADDGGTASVEQLLVE